MKKYFTKVLLLLLAVPTVSYGEVRISTLNSHMPRIQVSEKVMGRIYKQLQIPWRLLRIPTDDALHGANSGVVDGELVRIKGVENTLNRLQRIPYPIGTARVVAYTLKEAEAIQGLADLAGKRLALIRGVALTDKLAQGLEKRYADTIEGGFRMLDNRQADVVVTFQLDIERFLESEDKVGNYVSSKPLVQADLFHYIHKRNGELIERLSRHMKRLKQSGELQQMIDQAEDEVIYPK